MPSSLSRLLLLLFLLSWFLFGWQDKLPALGIMQSLPVSVIRRTCLLHSPHYKPGPLHLWGQVSSVHASDGTVATILSLLNCVCINRCATGLVSSCLVLCRTELDAPVFRGQSYVSSKCVLHCENVETLYLCVFYYFIRTFLLQKALFSSPLGKKKR